MYIAAQNGSSFVGGAERALVVLLAALQRRGHRVRLFCRYPAVAVYAEAQGVPTGPGVLGGDIMLPHALFFAARLRRERPDVLLLGTFKKTMLAGLAAHLAGVPRVVLRIGLETDVPRGRKYDISIRHWVDTVVLKTDDMVRRYLDAGVPPDKLVLIPGGAALRPRINPAGAVRRELGIPSGARVIGALARLAQQKRLDRFLRALALLPSDVRCIFAGEGAARGELIELAASLGLAERVHFLGDREDVTDVLDALDVYLISSDREGMSNSMMEALAAGVPVVSTRVSGAADALAPFANGETPGVVTGFDETELAAAVSRLLESPALRARASAAALARARESFDFERMVDSWEVLLAGTHT